ncbi:hypothetical protein NLX85_16695 [Micromonospora sp. A3M-1-15]|uniref:hypothetical protein n=1 Tax=Micromonospora sp. A3M-1-15 TaxID=2962035 RepID=UPI0020B7B048|nr:hypothetical protein [Micromonospora sp. A3M-1-15]MCP3785010.1 hypothetical protein [Micromonospora sp. A3M-1-15]
MSAEGRGASGRSYSSCPVSACSHEGQRERGGVGADEEVHAGVVQRLHVLAGITAIAAGAILTMVADTMIPEAFENGNLLSGLVTVAGFLLSFGLSQLGE